MAGNVGRVQRVYDGGKLEVCEGVWAITKTKYEEGDEIRIRTEQDERPKALEAQS